MGFDRDHRRPSVLDAGEAEGAFARRSVYPQIVRRVEGRDRLDRVDHGVSVHEAPGVELLGEKLAVDPTEEVAGPHADGPVSHRRDDVRVFLEAFGELLARLLIDLQEDVDEPVYRPDPGRRSWSRLVVGDHARGK